MIESEGGGNDPCEHVAPSERTRGNGFVTPKHYWEYKKLDCGWEGLTPNGTNSTMYSVLLPAMFALVP